VLDAAGEEDIKLIRDIISCNRYPRCLSTKREKLSGDDRRGGNINRVEYDY
jgi:hypothetical protein